MNRGFWPIANQGRGLENVAQTARSLAFPVTAEWSPALFGTGTAGVANSGTAASNTVCISGVMVYPSAQIPISYDTNENNRDHALVVALPTTESAFVVSPVRSKIPGFQNMLPLGEPRGKASVCIAPQRTDPANVASGAYAVSIGQNTKASSNASVALGSAAAVTGANGVALGSSSSCNGASAVALGAQANAVTNTSVAIGAIATTTGLNNISIGAVSSASGSAGAIAIGANASAIGSAAIAIGTAPAASGAFSICIGGSTDSFSLNRAVVIGENTRASYQRSLAFGVYNFVNTGDATLQIPQAAASTTDATSTEMFLGATAGVRVGIAASTAYTWQVQIIARQHAGAAGTIGDTAGWTIQGVTRRTAAGNATILGQSTITSYSDVGAAAWTAVVSADTTNQAMIITVTGEASKSIRWLAFWNITRLGA